MSLQVRTQIEGKSFLSAKGFGSFVRTGIARIPKAKVDPELADPTIGHYS